MANETLQSALKALQGQITIAENALKLYRSKLDALEKSNRKNPVVYQQTIDRANSLQALIDHYRFIFLHYLIRLSDELFEKFIVSPVCVHAYPVFGIAVIGLAYPVVMFLQFRNTVRVALDRHIAQVIDVEIAEHVARDIEYQHILGIFEGREGEFLHHVSVERKTI